MKERRVICEWGSDDENSLDESYNPFSNYDSSDDADDTSTSGNDLIECKTIEVTCNYKFQNIQS